MGTQSCRLKPYFNYISTRINHTPCPPRTPHIPPQRLRFLGHPLRIHGPKPRDRRHGRIPSLRVNDARQILVRNIDAPIGLLVDDHSQNHRVAYAWRLHVAIEQEVPQRVEDGALATVCPYGLHCLHHVGVVAHHDVGAVSHERARQPLLLRVRTQRVLGAPVDVDDHDVRLFPQRPNLGQHRPNTRRVDDVHLAVSQLGERSAHPHAADTYALDVKDASGGRLRANVNETCPLDQANRRVDPLVTKVVDMVVGQVHDVHPTVHEPLERLGP